MSLLVDEIFIDGVQVPGKVVIEFSNVRLVIDPHQAKEMGIALYGQAERAEGLA